MVNIQGYNYSTIETNRANQYARWERQRNKNSGGNPAKEEAYIAIRCTMNCRAPLGQRIFVIFSFIERRKARKHRTFTRMYRSLRWETVVQDGARDK